jgi:hypothetical protein
MNIIPVRTAQLFLVLYILLFPFSILAQHGSAPTFMYVDGYVFLDGDTVYGKLKWKLKYVENNPVEIKFESEEGKSNDYNARDITGFGNYTRVVKEDFDSDLEFELEHYVSMPSYKKGIPVFLNRLLPGKITVFLNRSSSQIGGNEAVEMTEFDGFGFSFSRDEGLQIGPEYRTSYKIIEKRVRFSSFFVLKQNSEMIKLTKKNYDNLFPDLFEDCPEILKEIEKNPDLRKFKNFMLLAELYNQICN